MNLTTQGSWSKNGILFCFVFKCVCMHTHVSAVASGGQETALATQELKLQAVVNHLLWHWELNQVLCKAACAPGAEPPFQPQPWYLSSL